MNYANLLRVVNLGHDLFAKHIIRPPIKGHIISAVLSLLRIERDGYVINRFAIKRCVDLLLQLSDSSYGTTVYKRYLEHLILRQSYAYYSAQAGRLLVTCDALEYLRRVNPLSLQLIFLAYSCDVRFDHGSSRKSRMPCSTCHHRPYPFFWLFSRMLS